jgi:hypothetical protein
MISAFFVQPLAGSFIGSPVSRKLLSASALDCSQESYFEHDIRKCLFRALHSSKGLAISPFHSLAFGAKNYARTNCPTLRRSLVARAKNGSNRLFSGNRRASGRSRLHAQHARPCGASTESLDRSSNGVRRPSTTRKLSSGRN